MKQKIVIVIIVMVITIYFTFPKRESDPFHYYEASDILYFDVRVDGEVQFPKTYRFFEEITVYEAIMMAGGLTTKADDSSITYGDVINQNTVITIAAKTDDNDEPTILVNINEASFAELLTVPYMSESRAAYIIMYREEHGDFVSLDALINVKYIGAATLENIRPYLTLS